MRQGLVLILVCFSHILCQASQLCGPMSSQEGVTSTTHLFKRAHALLEMDISETEQIQLIIIIVREVEERATEKAHITDLLNDLIIKWATILVTESTKNGSFQACLKEISECIKQLSATIGSDLAGIQHAWSSKQNFGNKAKIVSSNLRSRKTLIERLIQEQESWEDRQLRVGTEITESPDPIDRTALQNNDSYKSLRRSFDEIKGHLEERVQSTPTRPEKEDDDDESEESLRSNALDIERTRKHMDDLSRYVAWNLSCLVRVPQKEPLTLDEIQKEMSILLDDLEMQGELVLRAVSEYRTTLERILANREAYVRYRTTESIAFDCEHTRLRGKHIKKLVLLARLKLLYMKQDPQQKEYMISDEEIKLLETYKEDLSLEERTEVSRLQPSLFSRIKSLVS